MNSKYKTIKYKKNKPSPVDDLVSIEEPLEMIVRYQKSNKWIEVEFFKSNYIASKDVNAWLGIYKVKK